MEQMFINKDHGAAMMKSLTQLWHDNRYCDAVLEIDSENLEFHKLVLVACSPFLLGNKSSQSDSGKLVLRLAGDRKEGGVEAAKTCLNFIYEGVVKLTESNVDSVIEIAELLCIEDLVMFCSSFQDLLRNMKKLKKSSSDDVKQRTKTYELVISHEKLNKSKEYEATVSNNRSDSTKEVKGVGEIGTAASDFDDNSHSDFEETIESNEDSTLFRNVLPDSADIFTMALSDEDYADVKMEAVKMDMDNADYKQFVKNSDTDVALTNIKYKSAKATETNRKLKKCAMSDITVVKSESGEILAMEAEQEEMNVEKDLKRETMFQCHLCDKVYCWQSSLDKHVRGHHTCSEPQYACQSCAKVYRHKTSLDQHVTSRHNSNLKNFMCDLCGVKYLTKWSLTRHVRSHNDSYNNPLLCRICGKGYSRNDLLQAHERTHFPKTKCNQCDKEVYHIKEHLKICSSLKKNQIFQCKHCNKKFKESRYLREHLKNKHYPTKHFCCENCGFKFNYRASLLNHRKKCKN